GVDFTPIMIEKARENAEKRGFNNVEFRLGDIEKLPLTSNVVDVVVSNCVLNLVPNKKAVFQEILRVLKPGGHFSISDVVLVGDLPTELAQQAEMYAGCVSGAIQKDTYINLIAETGFTDIKIQKEKSILLPDDILKNYLDEDELTSFKNSDTGIFSITVFASKPDGCKPGNGCC
ncbi:MAG: methyltransferase domain-containing protein, partial [Lutibacter sp.]